jgi:hypothetical protein
MLCWVNRCQRNIPEDLNVYDLFSSPVVLNFPPRSALFCDVTQRTVVISYRSFGTTHRVPSSRQNYTKLSPSTPWRQEGKRGIAPFILNLSTRRRWVFNFTPRPLCCRERPPESVSTFWRRKKISSTLLRFEPRIVQTVACSPYGLNYPDCGSVKMGRVDILWRLLPFGLWSRAFRLAAYTASLPRGQHWL